MTKKMLKPGLILMGSIILGTALFPGVTAFADENTVDVETVKQEIKMLEESNKYDFELVPIENISKDNIIELESVEELEDILKEIKETSETEYTFDETFDDLSNNTKQTRAAGSTTISQWAPFDGWGMNGLACWKNVGFSYQYKKVGGKNQFTSVSGINSYYSGIQVAVSWKQTSASYNLVKTKNTNDTAKIKVNGYSLLGFQVKGFAIGAKINGTWNVSHRI